MWYYHIYWFAYQIKLSLHFGDKSHLIMARASVLHTLGCGATCRCLCSGRASGSCTCNGEIQGWLVALAAMEALAVLVCSCSYRVSPRACAWQWRLVTWFRVLGHRCMAGGCRRVMAVRIRWRLNPQNPLSALSYLPSPLSPRTTHTHTDLEAHVKLAKGLSVHN